MDSNYLVRGATLECTSGSVPRKLNLPLCHGVYTTHHPLANKMDNVSGVNIMPFGICKVTGEPCVPAPSGPWEKPHRTTFVTGYEAITEESFLVCSTGGLIEPLDCGQGLIEVEGTELDENVNANPSTGADPENPNDNPNTGADPRNPNVDPWLGEYLADLDRIQSVIDEFNSLQHQGLSKGRRIEYLNKYESVIKEILDKHHPGEYDRLLNQIHTAVQSDQNTTKDFREAIVGIAKLREPFSGVPTEVFAIQSCWESGNGASKRAKNNYNLFGVTYNLEFTNYAQSMSEYEMNFKTYLSTPENPKGHYAPLFDIEDKPDNADFIQWMHMMDHDQLGYCADEIEYGQTLLDELYYPGLEKYFVGE